MRRLGQSSMEFLSFVALSAIILAAMYSVMTTKEVKALEFQNRQEAQKIAEKVSFQAEMAMVQEDGYSRVFSIPDTIAGEAYNVTLNDRSSVVKWGNNTYSRQTLYARKEINITTRETSVFRVVNSDGEVNIIAEK